MKILKRTFIFPVLIHKTSTGYSGKPDISLRLRKSKMAGTMKTTAYTLQIVTKKMSFSGLLFGDQMLQDIGGVRR